LEGQLYYRHADSMSFSVSSGLRNELVQYLVRKHAGDLSKDRLILLVQSLVELRKTGYEPSRSAMWQYAPDGQRPADLSPWPPRQLPAGGSTSASPGTPHPPSPAR
jgi:hypothetical protein